VRKININKVDSTWNYPNMPLWGGNRGLFLMDPVGDYITIPVLPKQLPPKERYISDKIIGNDYVEIFNSFNCDITIKNDLGDSIDYKISDNKISNSLDTGIPIIPVIGSEHPPIGYYIPEDKYSIELFNIVDTTVYVSLFGDSLTYSINRSENLQAKHEKFIFDNSNHECEILNLENTNKVYNTYIIQKDEDYEKVMEIDNLNLQLNDLVKFDYDGVGILKVDNQGGEKNYNLSLVLVSAYEELNFEHSNIVLNSGCSHIIKPNWQDLIGEEVIIYVDNNSDGTIDDTLEVENQATGIQEETNSVPNEFILSQNYPNPFNPNTFVKYSLPENSHIKLQIFNTLGELVETVLDEDKSMGVYTQEIYLSKLSSGIYYYSLSAQSLNSPKKYREVRKMILLK